MTAARIMAAGLTCLSLVWPAALRDASARSAASKDELNCLIEPNTTVTVSTPVEGIVESVTVERGDLVEAGQVLAKLESSVQEAEVAVHRYRSEMQAELKSTQTRYEFSLRKLARAEELSKKETISRHELDEAQTEKLLAELARLEVQEKKRLAELEYKRAQAALGLRTIRSPLAGAVAERLVSPGDYRNNLDPKILKIAQIHPLRVEVFVPVSMFGSISVGTRAEVIPEAPLDAPRIAEVKVVDRVVDAASGTFAVRLELPNPNYQLPAGLKCKIRFLPR
ncbi:MAG: efflux RND transporter periplasmic adaptor subunit [Nitrospira sp.]|nr:efflux RND transporter periplasmic adaptor subunit [Nitrospira sp.]